MMMGLGILLGVVQNARRYKWCLDEMQAQARARKAEIRERFDRADRARMVGLIGEDIAELKLAIAGMAQLLLDQGKIEKHELADLASPGE